MRLNEERDSFVFLSVIGLSVLFCIQAFVNMAVNLGMFPPKGMTLPFISYGGSSSLAIGLTLGMLLALTRRRVGISHV
jgi:cell division protein FtsW